MCNPWSGRCISTSRRTAKELAAGKRPLPTFTVTPLPPIGTIVYRIVGSPPPYQGAQLVMFGKVRSHHHTKAGDHAVVDGLATVHQADRRALTRTKNVEYVDHIDPGEYRISTTAIPGAPEPRHWILRSPKIPLGSHTMQYDSSHYHVHHGISRNAPRWYQGRIVTSVEWHAQPSATMWWFAWNGQPVAESIIKRIPKSTVKKVTIVKALKNRLPPDLVLKILKKSKLKKSRRTQRFAPPRKPYDDFNEF